MGLKFVLGGSGSGKSYMMYQQIIAQAMEEPQRQFLIVVPDQYTMEIQKEVVALHKRNAILNIDVLSFSRLYHRVMEELGESHSVTLDDTGKNLLIRKIAGEKKEELPMLGRLLKKQGYISEMKSVISELLQYGISMQAMDSLIDQLKDRRALQGRFQDIRTLYQAFLEKKNATYHTSEAIYPVLAERLRDSKFVRNSTVFFDGFTGFTPVQMPLIREMLLLAKECYMAVTIGTDPSEVIGEHELWHLSAKTIRDVERLAKENEIEVHPYIWSETKNHRFWEAPQLYYLEQHLFRKGKKLPSSLVGNIEIGEAKSIRSECKMLARKIKKMVRLEGYQYRELAIICGSVDAYREELEEAFQKMEIPYFVDTASKILLNPMVEMIQGLFELYERDFDYASIMRYLRSGLSSVSLEEADLLSRYLSETSIRSLRSFSKPFMRKAKQFDLVYINEIREKFLREVDIFDQEVTVLDYATTLYQFLVNRNLEEKMESYARYFEEIGEVYRAKEYLQIYKKVAMLCNQMVMLLGEEPVEREVFSQILIAGFEELQVGLVPAKADQIVIGDMERTRISKCKVLFVVGVNDVNIPGQNTKGGMISDIDREYLVSLGMELAPTKRQLQYRQQFYLYQQLTKASKKLCLSYALVDHEEKAMKPSYFIGLVRQLFPKIELSRLEEDLEVEHSSELSLEIPELLRQYIAGSLEQVEPLFQRMQAMKKAEGAEFVESLIERAFIRGGNELIDQSLAKELYGAVLYGSISRLEQYASCPYAHFLKYGMKLKETSEFVLESADLGSIFHDILADFSKGLKKDGLSWSDFTKDYAEDKIGAMLEQVREQYKDELFLDKARNGYALVRAGRILQRSISVLQTHMKSGEFQLYGSELAFDVDCTWNASSELLMRLRGRIDRIDTAELDDDVYVKIIDYKSGNKKLQLDSMYAGLQMQLIVYLDSAIKMISNRSATKTLKPAAMFYYKVADPVVSMDGEEDFESLADTLLKEHKYEGMVNGEETVIRLLDREMETSSNMIPVSYKKDGSFSSNSKVCREEDFQLMRDFARKKLAQMGEEIQEGHIEKSPYVKGKLEEACTYCSYRGICGFDESLTGYQKRIIASMTEEESLEKMREGVEESNGN